MKTRNLRRIFAMTLALALLCGAIPSAFAVETADPVPDSVLYYGRVEAISRNENGDMTALHMASERYGEYIMHLSKETVWIDSGNRTPDDPTTLTEGEGIYVFHSPVSTHSMPPQSVAYAIVRNIPQDVGCAQYHKVSEAAIENGQLKITVDQGGLSLHTDDKTSFSFYNREGIPTQEDIPAGSWVMAWYDVYAAVYPGQTYAHHIMVLDCDKSLTRADFITLLHTAQGNPMVNYAMSFSDVAQDADYAQAIRWAVSEGLAAGYGDGCFGPDDPITREQAVVILWRKARSPMLMDYPGLTQYEDVSDISRFAQQAMVWAHQKGLLNKESKTVEPHAHVTESEITAMLETLNDPA